MLSLFASSAAFQGPAMKAGGRSTAVQMRAEGEIGVTPPLGVYDPLNILATPVGWARARGAKRRGDILGAGKHSIRAQFRYASSTSRPLTLLLHRFSEARLLSPESFHNTRNSHATARSRDA